MTTAADTSKKSSLTEENEALQPAFILCDWTKIYVFGAKRVLHMHLNTNVHPFDLIDAPTDRASNWLNWLD